MIIETWEEYMYFTKYLKKETERISSSGILNKTIKYIFNETGKKLRPLILMLSCEIVSYKYKQSLSAGLAIEAIHTASLVHDDILDEGLIRRNKMTINKKYNTKIAILCGDLLISKSIVYISKYDQIIVNLFGKLGINLCCGEAIDIETKNIEMTKNKYIDCIKKKTASLFELSAMIGCLIGKGNKKELNALKKFGRYFGIAYQLIDDILENFNCLKDKKSIVQSESLYSIYMKTMSKDDALNTSLKIINIQLKNANRELDIFNDKNNKIKQKFNYLVHELEIIKNKIKLESEILN